MWQGVNDKKSHKGAKHKEHQPHRQESDSERRSSKHPSEAPRLLFLINTITSVQSNFVQYLDFFFNSHCFCLFIQSKINPNQPRFLPKVRIIFVEATRLPSLLLASPPSLFLSCLSPRMFALSVFHGWTDYALSTAPLNESYNRQWSHGNNG